ncbi:hypothetical protein CsNV_098 [Callinectes sapidus nudivirus]|nr:hypothetical protein CsNV_098 [Callinectes sapidus nudivirus]
MNTTLSNSWKCYTLNAVSMELPITKKVLYNMCLSGHILAFTYDIARNKKLNTIKVIFKVISSNAITDIQKLWDVHYLKPQELPRIDFIMTVYIPRKLILTISKTEKNTNCKNCNNPKYQVDDICLNKDCSKFVRDYKKYISQGKVVLDYEDLQYKELPIPCKKCKSCKNCKKRNVKCSRHKICKHGNTKMHYHTLNRIVNNSL